MFRTEKIRKLVAMGIPESLRGRLWLLFSGKLWCAQALGNLGNRLRMASCEQHVRRRPLPLGLETPGLTREPDLLCWLALVPP